MKMERLFEIRWSGKLRGSDSWAETGMKWRLKHCKATWVGEAFQAEKQQLQGSWDGNWACCFQGTAKRPVREGKCVSERRLEPAGVGPVGRACWLFSSVLFLTLVLFPINRKPLEGLEQWRGGISLMFPENDSGYFVEDEQMVGMKKWREWPL